MKVLLVSAATPTYKEYYAKSYSLLPNGILYIAAMLEKQGHMVEIFDCLVDDRKPEDFVTFNPDIVGFSVLLGPNLEGSIAQSKEFRKLMPRAKIVWGSVHPSVLPEQTVAEPYIDYVVIGAGEYTLLELIQHLENGNGKLDKIKGLAYKNNGNIQINEPRPFIKNLEELPDPAWHLVDVGKYSDIGLNTSRGCMHHCAFCYNKAYNKGYIGYISAEKIVSQIEHMKREYGTDFIRFHEDNFTFNRKRLREFCRLLIERKLKIRWSCDSRADLSEADIALMAKSGCVTIALGMETGSQRMLDFVQKDITVAEMERTFWSLIKYRIRTSVYLMYGTPTETIDDFEKTHEMLGRLDNPYYMYNRFVPFPGSALYDYCVDHQLISPPQKLADWSEFLMLYSHGGNLSQVPLEMMEEAAKNWRETYAAQRIRFTMRHNPSYFWIVFRSPIKFLRELRELIKFHSQVNGFHKKVVRRLAGISNGSKEVEAPVASKTS